MPLGDDAAVKIMSRLGLDYSVAIKSTDLLRISIERLNKELTQMKLNALAAAKDINRTFASQLGTLGGPSTSKIIYDQYGDPLKVVQQEAFKTSDSMKKMASETKKHVTQMTDGLNNGLKRTSMIASQFERRLGWFIAGTAFYGGIKAMREMVSTMSDVEQGMIVIARTTDDLTFNLEEMRTSLLKVGQEYGHTWDTVQDIAIKWTQAGYNVADTLELTKTSLLALNVAEMDVTMATQGLISMMAQWGYQAEDLELVIDKLNITADNYAVTTGDLVEGLMRASGAANAMGLSFDETVGLITAMRVASGRLGREVGNALNTILAYITRQSTLNVLMESGIEVFADAAHTKLRPAMELLFEVSEKWMDKAEQMPAALLDIADEMGVMSEEMAEIMGMEEDWTDLQKINIETSIAGVRRRNFLIGLLRNFAQAEEVIVEMQNAEGYSMRENVKTMDTLDKKYNALKMSATELAVAIGEAGLLDALKDLVDAGKSALDIFNSLDDTTKNLIVNLGLLFTVIKSVQAIMKLFSVGAGGVGATTAAAGAAAGAAAAKGTFLGMGPVGWGLMGVSALFMTIHSSIARANEETKKHLESVSTLGEQYFELTESLKLVDAGSTQYKKTQESIQNVTSDLIKIQPSLIKSVNSQTRAVEVNEEALRESIDSYEKLNTQHNISANLLESVAESIEAIRKAETEQLAQLEKEDSAIKTLVENYAMYEEGSTRRMEIEKTLKRLIGETALADIQAAEASGDITIALDRLMRKREDAAEAARENAIKELGAEKIRLEGMLTSIQEEIDMLSDLVTARREALKEIPEATITAEPVFSGTGIGDYWSGVKKIFSGYWGIIKGVITEKGKREALVDSLFSPVLKEKVEEIVEKRQADAAKKALTEAERDLADAIARGEETQNILDKLIADLTQALVGKAESEVAGLSATTIEPVIDRYLTLNGLLGKINNALELNKVLQEQATDEQRISLIDKENNLLKEKQRILKMINQEQIEEREELRRELSWEGFAFDSGGLISNYEQRIRTMYQIASSIPDEQKEARRDAISDIEEITSKIERYVDLLTDEIPSVTTNIEKINGLLAQNVELVEEINKEIEASKFDEVSKTFEHWTKMGLYNLEQQIDMIRQLYKIKELTTEETWRLDERLADRYVDLLKEQQKEIENAYKDRIKMIENEADEKIKAKQHEIEAVEQIEKTENRLEAERKHNEKLSDLLEERQYHEVRTGEEHRKRIVEIDKQLEEERISWEKTKRDWELSDKKEALRSEIDEIKEKLDEQKELWKQAYEDMQADFSEHNLNMIAIAGTFNEQYFEDGLNKGKLWLEGFRSGSLEEIDRTPISEYVGDIKGKAIHDFGMSDSDYRKFIENGEKWWDLHYQGKQQITDKEMQRLNDENNKLREKYGIPPGEYPKFHTGAKTLSYGLGFFKPGELIFPDTLAPKIEALISALSMHSTGNIQQLQPSINNIDRGNNYTFNAPLFNSEKTVFDDEVDGEILGRELKRAIISVK